MKCDEGQFLQPEAGLEPQRLTVTTITISAMTRNRANAQQSIFRRAIDLWPYLFIIISVTGLAYMVITSAR